MRVSAWLMKVKCGTVLESSMARDMKESSQEESSRPIA